MSSDQIEKQVVLKAPLEQVWRAISDADEFGQWFGVRFDGPFVEGAALTGVMTPTSVDRDVAKSPEAYAGIAETWWIVAFLPCSSTLAAAAFAARSLPRYVSATSLP